MALPSSAIKIVAKALFIGLTAFLLACNPQKESSAVSNLLAARRSVNAASAVEATRLIHSTEVTYQAGVGRGSFGSATNLFEQDFIDGVLAGAAGVGGGKVSISGDQV